MNSPARLESIDQYRGFAILTMVLANFLGGIAVVPAWMKHAPDIGLTAIDLIAPFFIFAIGLTYRLSAQRRLKAQGWKRTIEHFIMRFAALIGIGALISQGELWFGIDPNQANWGVLQAIGVAGLLTLPLIQLSARWRWLFGLGLLAGYQFLLDRFWLQTVLLSAHGGVQGALGWTAMMILATALTDLFHDPERGRRSFPWVGLALLVLGLAVALLVPVSKHRISASYVLITLAASALLFWLFHLWADVRQHCSSLLGAWGKNPLVLYFLHYLVIGIFAMSGIPALYHQAPAWLVGLQSIFLLAVLSWIGLFLARRQWFFSF